MLFDWDYDMTRRGPARDSRNGRPVSSDTATNCFSEHCHIQVARHKWIGRFGPGDAVAIPLMTDESCVDIGRDSGADRRLRDVTMTNITSRPWPSTI
jgi:hypothetical protein